MHSYLLYGRCPAGLFELPGAQRRGWGALDGSPGRGPPCPSPHGRGSSGRGWRRLARAPRVRVSCSVIFRDRDSRAPGSLRPIFTPLRPRRSGSLTPRLPVRCNPALPRTTAPAPPHAAGAEAIPTLGGASHFFVRHALLLPPGRAGRGVPVPRPWLLALAAPPLRRRTRGKLSTASGADGFLLPSYPCVGGGILLHNAFTRLFPLGWFQ